MGVKRFSLFALILVLAGTVSACGGGGGGGGGIIGPDYWMTVNVASQSTPTTTNTYTGGLTGKMILFGEVTTDQTLVEMAEPSLEVALCSGGTTTGSYPVSTCSGGGATVDYLLISGSTYTDYMASNYYSESSGTVTLTNVGAHNKPIIGTFDAIVSNGTDTKRVWGEFHVKNYM